MSKKDFIALADAIRSYNKKHESQFDVEQIRVLANFCKMQNSRFLAERWLSYIAGECGPSGGAVREEHAA